MIRRSLLFCLAFSTSYQSAFAQERDTLTPTEHLGHPYVALFDTSDLPSSRKEVSLLRRDVEEDKKQQMETCAKDRKGLHRELDAVRRGLKLLNDTAPRDTRTMATSRDTLHSNITALEQALRDNERYCEHTIPATFELKLAKVHLLEQWPRRRAETIRKIEEGRARARRHGDVDDIGYRKLIDDQEKDIAVGQQAVRQMTSGKLPPVEVQDLAIRQYVQDLASQIGRNSDLRIPVHTILLRSPEINAIGLPGGFMLITSGLLLATQTEAEFAGVISQQIAHIAARHATRRSKRSIIAKMFVPAAQVATGLFTGGVSNAGVYYGMNYGFQGMGILVDRSLVSSNADAQREADQLGIQYAWKAGFDPKGFVTFVDSIAKAKDYSTTESFLMTKPPLAERLLDSFTEIKYLPARETYRRDSAEFRKTKEALAADNAEPRN
jgi:Peptidase family M48